MIKKVAKIIAVLAAVAVLILLRHAVTTVLAIFLLGALIAFLLMPVMRNLEGRIGASCAAAVCVAGSIALLAGVLYCILPQLAGQTALVAELIPMAMESAKAPPRGSISAWRRWGSP